MSAYLLAFLALCCEATLVLSKLNKVNDFSVKYELFRDFSR